MLKMPHFLEFIMILKHQKISICWAGFDHYYHYVTHFQKHKLTVWTLELEGRKAKMKLQYTVRSLEEDYWCHSSASSFFGWENIRGRSKWADEMKGKTSLSIKNTLYCNKDRLYNIPYLTLGRKNIKPKSL